MVPGAIRARVGADGVTMVEIRAPRYDDAGHTVTLDDPELLLDDITTWLARGG